MRFLRANRLTSVDKTWYASLSEGESQILLARSYDKVPKPWSRLSIKVVIKEDKKQIVRFVVHIIVHLQQ